ncbi:hypothetical protein chiPu_0002071 [Chiloscyllium punctatum]|uniref:Uncharacterized protein n=1 Tax=Chiloscyllium punctatum TaxID=137246 RepID=A0A401RZU2_CHIPU|nr:hypothetical protein [Chiloscyllium punctatum]
MSTPGVEQEAFHFVVGFGLRLYQGRRRASGPGGGAAQGAPKARERETEAGAGSWHRADHRDLYRGCSGGGQAKMPRPARCV